MKNTQPTTIMCDFDGTISQLCLGDFLYEKFASCGLKYADLWAEGKIGTREEIISSFQHISASREEMEQVIETLPAIPGFKAFYDFCQSEDYNLIIVSDGLDWSIRYFLSQIGVKEIEVLSNQIIFEENGHRFNFPYYNEANPKSGVCKEDIAMEFKQSGQSVYLIGDGRTDFEAAKVVDFVFARDGLWDYCKEHNLPSFHYNDFFEIIDALQNSGIG